MTISELYEVNDDISDVTRIRVFKSKYGKQYVGKHIELIFSGMFDCMSNELKQSKVVCFGSYYAKDTTYIII